MFRVRTAQSLPAPPTSPQATPSRFTALHALNLPPAIMLDSHLLRAEDAVRRGDIPTARAAMEEIERLPEEHTLGLTPEYHYRYAAIWHAVGAWDKSLAAVVRYLELTQRDGDYYLDALMLMNRATAAIQEAETARELRAAELARARAAEARDRAERQRALNAAVDVLTRMEFASIPPGRFRMGDDHPSRRPRTQVRLTRPFEIGRYEVMQSQWIAVMGDNPSRRSRCGRCPVDTNSWPDVQRFISILNVVAEGSGLMYRLPTEAEWLYAARAGRGGDRVARNPDGWVMENSEGRTHPVGLREPNGYGLYDMFGNLRELTGDWYAPYPGGTVTDPTGHPSGLYTTRYGTAPPRKVTLGCAYDTYTADWDCERALRNSLTSPPQMPADTPQGFVS